MGESRTESESGKSNVRAPSPFEAPQIGLPKGGGAIRGIDEKFTANPATGTGSVAIPLALSAGRSGFGPTLSLGYDSGRGNGPFGIGWSLSLPDVSRSTAKQLPRYLPTVESEDIFILSGAEDLVPVLRTDHRGALDVEEFDRAGYRVRRYRPRVEGLFARIERWICLASGVAHWRSISRDNVLTVYGLDARSRIADPDDPTHIFSWLICRSYDDRGNAIVYDYAAENDHGVDLCRPSEQVRSRTANRYLKRIRYGNRKPLLIDTGKSGLRACHLEPHDLDSAEWMFEAVFDYGEGHYAESAPDAAGRLHSCASLEPHCAWAARKDPFSSYRSGFEIRTHRLCRRVLMFHHFEREIGIPAALVRSLSLQYREKSVGSFLERVTAFGHRHLGEGRYLTRSLAPADFLYTDSPLEDPLFDGYELKEVQPDSLENLPAAVGTDDYRFVDLDGEGISGVLAEQDATWFYKPNRGEGRLGAVETVSLRPATANLASGQQLMDLAGDGTIDVVELSPDGGFYERTDDAKWEGFRPFNSLPVLNWADPNLRFVDLTGDGIADVLITEDDAFTWHRSLGEQGFGPGIRVAVPLEEGRGPCVIFGDGTQSIYLADMTGDGMADLVRIRNGEICYWPNLGYGRFGAKVAMEGAPWFDDADLFDQKRIRLADVDGSGTTDIVYLGGKHIQIYLNEAGNTWLGVRKLKAFPRIDDLSSVTVADFLGRGTACLLWSSSLPGDCGRHIRYVDLMCGVKPHLLSRTVNNLGAETRIIYASSTRFYLADKAAGTPWITRLPFPVHVVDRVETYDHVSRNRFVTRYSYHHGFYDDKEREFRGFGRVDQLDTEEIGSLASSSDRAESTNTDAASSVAPVLTRTWFHTGVFLGGGRVSRHLAREYYSELADAILLDDTVLPASLSPEEAREACRALKGSMLRQEVYALDAKKESTRPYSVTESNLTVRLVQARGPNRHAVLFAHAREQVICAYERKLYEIDKCLRADPRVSHNVVLEVDGYGNVLKSVAIAYGRRLTENAHDFQKRVLLTLTENDHTNAVHCPDAYRAPFPAEQRLFELRGLTPDSSIHGVTIQFRFREIASKVALLEDACRDIPFEAWRSDDGRVGRRLLKKTRTRYRSNDLAELLPLGHLQSLALPGENYGLATPATCLREKIGAHETALRTEGGYVDLDGDNEWWAPSGRVFYSHEAATHAAHELRHAAAHFFIPLRYADPFGNSTNVVLDAHDLMPVETTDAVGNVTRAEIDYRVLAPRLQIDANGNRSEAAFDALGLVAGTAVQGKDGEAQGDSLEGFEPDLDPRTVRAFLHDPRGASGRLLGRATTRMVYDAERYLHSNGPAFAAAIGRETHESDLEDGQQTRTQVRIAFSDGFGREIQTKMQAEPGPVKPGGGVIAHRWIGSGWTIFNNKGKPVRKYEPFFSAVADFEFAAIEGVSPILLYDPLGRVIATLHPDHTFEKVVFDPWQQLNWDAGDTVHLNPKTDPDVGELVSRLPDPDYLPTWYGPRIAGALGEGEKTAALGAARHADTPSAVHFDSLGRSVLAVVDNGVDDAGRPRKYATLTVLDVEGNSREVIDALGRSVMGYDYDMAGRRVHQASMEAGERWTLNDISDKPIRGWNSRLFMFRTEYDPLRRPVRQFVQGGDPYERNAGANACEMLFERTVYGDDPDNGLTEHRQRAANLRGRIFRHFDTAGVTTADLYDFKGNVLQTSRQFARDYRSAPDWSKSPAFESRRLDGRSTYDALNRVVISISPDGSIHRPTYNDAGLIERIDVALRAAHCKSTPPWTPFVRNIDYNARAQRTRVDYANGVATSFEYDPATFRLARLRTTRPADRDARAAEIFADAACIQDLRYHYDPVGNITQIVDRALRTVFHDNQRIDATCRYTYDPLYRLTAATGREHVLQSAFRPAPADNDYRDYPFVGASAQGNLQSLEAYAESYEYDAVGNFLHAAHRSAHNNWTRRYAYDEPSLIELDMRSNRLSRTKLGLDSRSTPSETYLYDANGNIVQMPHLPLMRWDFLDRFAASSRQIVNCGTPETTYYIYDSSGERVRKVTDRANGSRKTERLYVGGFELFREFAGDGGDLTLERETLHVMDDQQRVAVVETLTVDRDDALLSGVPLQRFQLANHLGSASIELDEAAGLVSYEEYTPYGTTVFQTGRSASEVKLKRYRYTGKERDDENGFTYYGARYCASWLGRWVSADPSGFADGLNLYAFCRGDPIANVDRDGRQSDEELDAGAPSAPPDQGDAGTTQPNPDETLTVPAAEPGTSLPGGAAPQEQAEQGQVVKEYVPRQGELAREKVKEGLASAAHSANDFREGVGAGLVNTPAGIVQGATETAIKEGETAVAHPALTAVGGLPFLAGAAMLSEGNSKTFHAVHDAFEGVKVDYPRTGAGEVGNFFGGELATLPLALVGGGGAGAGRGALSEEAVLTSRASRSMPFDPKKLAKIKWNLTGQVDIVEDTARLAAENAKTKGTAGAMYLPKTREILLKANPSRAEVIEELLHFGQHRAKGFASDFGSTPAGIRNLEMEAQVRLANIKTIKWTTGEFNDWLAAFHWWRTRKI